MRSNDRCNPVCPTYTTLPLAQQPIVLARQLKGSYHLLACSNSFRCPIQERRFLSLIHSSMALLLGSLASSSATATSLGNHRSSKASKVSSCGRYLCARGRPLWFGWTL